MNNIILLDIHNWIPFDDVKMKLSMMTNGYKSLKEIYERDEQD